jgi:uncharacterized membrane protein YcfT
MDWVDIIKATSVVLVVLLHVTQTLAFAADGSAMAGFWSAVSTFLEPLRMPVFFVVSGILASSAVKRPWSHTKARTIGIAYLFLLWHTVLLFFSMAVDLIAKGSVNGGVAGALHDWFFQLFLTPGGYWYFYALVAYFVLARTLRNVNPWAVLAVAATINLARPLVNSGLDVVLGPLDTPNMMDAVLLNAVYFLAGVYLVDFFKGYAARNDSQLLAATAIFAVGGSVARMLSPTIAAGSFLPIAMAWVLTAILVAVRLQGNERVRAFGRSIGPRTLPIFVIQFLVMDVIYTWFGLSGAPLLNSSPILQALYPVVVTLAITAASLWIYDGAMRRRSTKWLFKAPARWTARPQESPRLAEPVADAAVDPAQTPAVTTVDPPAEWLAETAPGAGPSAVHVPLERDRRATGELPVIAV